MAALVMIGGLTAREAFALLRDDPELRVGILTAEGEKIFSAGWDLKALNAGDTKLDNRLKVAAALAWGEVASVNKEAATAALEGPEGVRLLLQAAANPHWDARHAAARAANAQARDRNDGPARRAAEARAAGLAAAAGAAGAAAPVASASAKAASAGRTGLPTTALRVPSGTIAVSA